MSVFRRSLAGVTPRSSAMRITAVLLAAFAFGVFAAWAKGQNIGVER